MGYLNPIEIHGYQRFADEAVAAGVDGVLVVDCPLEEAAVLAPLRAAGLQQILLAAPTTAPVRMAQLCEAAAGFLYYVSFAGITGAGRLSTQDIAARVADIRAHAKSPVAVGFGVKDAQSAKAIAGRQCAGRTARWRGDGAANRGAGWGIPRSDPCGAGCADKFLLKMRSGVWGRPSTKRGNGTRC
jgi:tryptophan synthase alpha subunit